MKHLNIEVFGLVQGVFFRKTTKEKALELNLTGFVKNTELGTVYIEVEGQKSLLDDFVNWLYQGSELAKVKKIKIEEAKLKEFKEFRIIK